MKKMLIFLFIFWTSFGLLASDGCPSKEMVESWFVNPQTPISNLNRFAKKKRQSFKKFFSGCGLKDEKLLIQRLLPISIASGDIKALNALVDFGANPKKTFNGQGMLSLAASYGHLEVFKKLLELKVEDTRDRFGNMAIHSAASTKESGDTKGSLGIINILIRKGGNIDEYNNRWQTPLFMAVVHNKPKIVNFLLNNGASTTMVRKRKSYLPEIAAENGSSKIIKLFKESSKRGSI